MKGFQICSSLCKSPTFTDFMLFGRRLNQIGKCYIKSGWLVGGGLRTYLVVLAMFSVFAVLAAGTIAANGRARLVSSQESGPYQIDVSIIPAEAIVGRTHVSILVLTLADKEPLTVAHVEIAATGPIGGAGFGPIPAPNDYFPSFFETDLPFDVPGDWHVQVTVHSDMGDASVELPMQVYESTGRINWILMAALVVILLAAGIFVWGKIPGRDGGRRSR